MQTKFLVQNPHKIPVTKLVNVGGEDMNVAIDGFEVQLLAQDGMSGTLVMRFYGADAKEAEATFKADVIITADWSAEKAAEAPVEEKAEG